MNDQLVDRVRALPGVAAAGYSLMIPLQQRFVMVTAFEVPRWPRDGEAARPPLIMPVHTDYLEVIGARLVAGRFFRPEDDRDAPVMIVNEALARSAFAGNPVGQLVRASGSEAPWVVIGVIADSSNQRSVADAPLPAFYVPAGQMVRFSSLIPDPIASRLWPQMIFAVRAERDPDALVPAIDATLRELEPRSAMTSITPLSRIVSNSMAAPRFYAAALGTFAGLALVLAAIGIYGLLAYSVAQRTREIGVRMALGARSGDVLRMVLRQAAKLAAIGAVIGIGGALAGTRVLATLLYGVGTLDPVTFVTVPILLIAVALFATYLPARRAARVDPMVALRAE
jgi:putative ABC transport system permease protein